MGDLVGVFCNYEGFLVSEYGELGLGLLSVVVVLVHGEPGEEDWPNC